jgi:hypothetical protein
MSTLPDKSLYNLSEEEIQMRDTVARLAKEQIEPHVRTMEDRGEIPSEIRDLLFQNGVNITLFFKQIRHLLN